MLFNELGLKATGSVSRDIEFYFAKVSTDGFFSGAITGIAILTSGFACDRSGFVIC